MRYVTENSVYVRGFEFEFGQIEEATVRGVKYLKIVIRLKTNNS